MVSRKPMEGAEVNLPGSALEFGALFRNASLPAYAGCGGLNSLRATAAPLWEFDVGGTALLASFRYVLAGSRHVCAVLRRQTETQAGESDANM